MIMHAGFGCGYLKMMSRLLKSIAMTCKCFCKRKTPLSELATMGR